MIHVKGSRSRLPMGKGLVLGLTVCFLFFKTKVHPVDHMNIGSEDQNHNGNGTQQKRQFEEHDLQYRLLTLETQRRLVPSPMLQDCVFQKRLWRMPKKHFGMSKFHGTPCIFPMFFSMFGHRTNEAFDCWPLASRGHDIKIVRGWHSKWSQLKDIFFSLLLYIHKKVCCSWCKMSFESF